MRIKRDVFEVMRPMPVFKPEMRKANRRGLKSQTRRVEKEQDALRYVDGKVEYMNYFGSWQEWVPNAKTFRCPYGKAGDYCYMREPMIRGFGDVAYYKDDDVMVRHALTGEPITWRWNKDVLTSIFMPKEAARSIYQYTSIRVERVQDISEEDAKAEGCVAWVENEKVSDTAVSDYAQLWNEINLARGFGWDANPWVWVLGYVEVRDGEN